MDSVERECIREYQAGSVEALGRLVEHTRRPLYGFISKMTGGHADSDEIFQEVWVRAMRSLDRYRDDRFLSWLFRIAHNLVIDRARKSGRHISLEQPEFDDGPPLAERLAEPAPDPAARAAATDMESAIARAVAELPPEQREVFLLRTEGDLPFKEIAKLQGVSINTALARMQYAIRNLRSILYEYDPNRKTTHEQKHY